MAEKKRRPQAGAAAAEGPAPKTRKVYRHSRYPNHMIAGVGTFVGGILALDDPELQEKLEALPNYGRDIKMIGTDLPVPTVERAEIDAPPGSSGMRSSQSGGKVIVGAGSTDDLVPTR